MVNLLFVFLTVTAAPAIDPGKAHFMLGAWEYEHGAVEFSIEEFQKAYSLTRNDAILFDLALAHTRCDNVYAAWDYLKAYIRHDPKRLTSDPSVRKLVDRLASVLNEYEDQYYDVVCGLPGCLVVPK